MTLMRIIMNYIGAIVATTLVTILLVIGTICLAAGLLYLDWKEQQ